MHQVRATPALWDNLVTFHAGYGIEESADDPGSGLVADPILVGNDLYGSAGLYLDEGAVPLASLAQVNGLPDARDNFGADPLFVDRPTDYHLAGASPAIDRGHADAPRPVRDDIDGDGRPQDGDGDGRAQSDVGADER